jgi:glycosyltransferase involved in cell wall biosynthesis
MSRLVLSWLAHRALYRLPYLRDTAHGRIWAGLDLPPDWAQRWPGDTDPQSFAAPLPELPEGIAGADVPLVSIITRTHGARGGYLARALDSVAAQTHTGLEVLVPEDGGAADSPDAAEVIRAATARHPHLSIRHLPLPPGGGRARSANAALAAAKGDVIGFLDDDDYLFPGHVAQLLKALDETPRAIAAWGLSLEARAETLSQHPLRCRVHSLSVPPMLRQPFDLEVLRHHNYLPIQSVLFRRKAADKTGGFTPGQEVFEDWDFWLRLAETGPFVRVPQITSLYHVPAKGPARSHRQKQHRAAMHRRG